MAGRYPDMFSEVDVVSSSKHIKKLLKTPFNQNTSYSMCVHRIGNSLFLNELNIPAFLKLNHLENKENLQWLYDLYCNVDNVTPQDRELHPKKRNKELSQLQMIESKFMYYSIGDKENSQEGKSGYLSSEGRSSRSNSICEIFSEPNVVSDSMPSIPPTSSAEEFPTGSYFMRDVKWTFEDITMLVGSDLPIFGGGRYPAVSLRLK